MKTVLCIITLMLCSLVWFGIGSSGNIDYVKDRAQARWAEQGFEVVGYEGYQWGFGGFGTPWGGAKVWYRLRKPGNDITYTGFLFRWGDELHVYGPKAIDAIRPD